MAVRVVVAVGGEAESLVAGLREAGFVVERCAVERVREVCAQLGPEACLLEPGAAALVDVLAPLVSEGHAQAIVVALAPADAALAEQALVLGALAVVPRPIELEWARAALSGALRAAGLERERSEHRSEIDSQDELVLAGDSPEVHRLGEDLERLAGTPRSTVLVTGERGVGKLAVARALHARSARSAAPRLEVRACEVHDAAAAALLFGEPGALGRRRGKLGLLEGGTLILSSVERLGSPAQGALAALLESRSDPLDVRVVATTECDLAAEVEAGRLREDLAYRLNVLTLRVPNLVERGADVPTLARAAFERAACALGRPWMRLDENAVTALAARPWPGNLRELDLHIRTAVLTGSDATLEQVAPSSPGREGPGGPEALAAVQAALPLRGLRLRDAEEALIRRVLAETGGNKLRAAEILGIHRTTLYHKLKGLGIA